MNLEPNAIVPEALHKKVGWDIRHHFMAEKIVDRFWLVSNPLADEYIVGTCGMAVLPPAQRKGPA